VCPWNAPKIVQATGEPDYLPRDPGLSGRPGRSGWEPNAGTESHPHPHAHEGPATDSPSLIELMRMTREEWDLWTRGSAIRRAGYAGFKRNVAVAIGNWIASVSEPAAVEAVAVLREALQDDSEVVREHAAWALEQAG
jgi:epoxyqueuosine reductase QueG